MAKSKRKIADDAWLRLNTPDEHGALPGQLSLGQTNGAPEVVPAIEGIPDRCPECKHIMTAEHGWAASVELCQCGHDLDHHPGAAACTSSCGCKGWLPVPYSIQCGNCGKRYLVTHVAWIMLKQAIRARYLALNPPKPPAQPKRGRGAR